MLLGRLRIRARLALLILVPLLATVALAAATSIQLAQAASRATDTADAVRRFTVVGALARALQQERLISVGLAQGDATRHDYVLARANTEDLIGNLQAIATPEITEALSQLARLDPLRAVVTVSPTTAPVADLIAAYTGAITNLLDAARLLEMVDGDTSQGRQVVALDAVVHANEGFATILVSLGVARPSPEVTAAYVGGLAALQPAILRFAAYGTPEQVQLYTHAITAVDARLGEDFTQNMVSSPGTALKSLTTPPQFAAIESLTGIGRFIESKIINDALAEAERSAQQEVTRAIGFIGLALVAILLALALGAAVARSVTNPVRRLTRSAERVARFAQTELVRVADDESLEASPVRMQPIDVSGRDELADFARAFGRVQETAAQLVERQVVSRRNVALMFGHVGRRTQNLVGRQVSLIDKLESAETEPSRLNELYRLDHISSRLRRNASSLVVLSGARGADEHVAPLPVADVIRLGLAEIEDYTRVDIESNTAIRIAPALIADLVLLLAELMENATSFSPPGTRVVVLTETTREGARVSVIDHGLGMAAERMAEENARLTRRERLDLAPTEVLGLFVVGRLARRHGISVTLSATAPSGGVTAAVEIPARLLSANPVVAQVPMAGAYIRREPVAELMAGIDPNAFDLGALDRATRTMHSSQPWNAFDAGAVETDESPAPMPTAAATTASPPRPAMPSWPPPAATPPATPPAATPPALTPPALNPPALTPPAALPPATVDGPAPTTRPWPPLPAGTPAAPRPEVPRPRPSTLNRRVPGKTLEALENAGPTGPARLAPSSADDARDSLAQFESGVARAMREMDSRDEGSQ